MSEPMVRPEAVGILRAARKLVRRGWVQRTLEDFIDGTNCYCIDGAVIRAQVDAKLPSVATGAGLCISLAARARGFETASRFNDAPGRKQSEVVQLFDEAIALAESLAGPQS